MMTVRYLKQFLYIQLRFQPQSCLDAFLIVLFAFFSMLVQDCKHFFVQFIFLFVYASNIMYEKSIRMCKLT